MKGYNTTMWLFNTEYDQLEPITGITSSKVFPYIDVPHCHMNIL